MRSDGQPSIWVYIACNGGTLYGSVVNEEHIVKPSWRPADMSRLFTESNSFFALDVEEGELLWKYDSEKSIRHNAIALGSKHVYLIDRPRVKEDLLQQQRRGESDEQPEEAHPLGKLIALDGRTGKIAWTQDEDVLGTVLQYSRP